MLCRSLHQPRRQFSGRLRVCVLLCGAAVALPAWAQAPPLQRLPREAPRRTAALQGVVRAPGGRGVVGASVTLANRTTGFRYRVTANGDGVFRLTDLAPGLYDLRVEAAGYEPLAHNGVQLGRGEVVTVELTLRPAPSATRPRSRLPRQPELGPPAPAAATAIVVPYREVLRQPREEPRVRPQTLPPASEVFQAMPDRWEITMPAWSRYGRPGEYPYVRGHWWDPFNRNRLKGDYPILGQQIFLRFTGTSTTQLDGRRLPTPSGVSTARPGSPGFFGKGEQFALSQTFRFSFDLFHGDTSFRPVDWRIRITPAVNVNDLAVRELGIVNPDVRRGTTRLDAHAGLQEAFAEVKLADLSANYDFISVRAGIQKFSSDFRGFLFDEEQPGVRLFGTLHSNRWQYNLAYFYFLEKDTNSGLNSFRSRHQQVILANFYHQDFLWPGYTAQVSVHYNKDDASVHYDENDFLVRPAPIGVVRPHNIRAVYLGWTGQGHIHWLNISHAFYQALGTDDGNAIAGRAVTIDAQMAAVEVSVDRDWKRFEASTFYASGDAHPLDGTARGFDTIVDEPAFAGGVFSLWNREAIRLTGAGVLLTPENSLIPSLRTSKEEGQANFVNPGIFLANAGANFDLTPKLTGVLNASFLRFMHTEPLEQLLFQAPIHDSIGMDYDLGFEYRPPLTENIVLRGGASALAPGQGFRDIYTGKILFSLFANLRLQF